MTDSALQTTTPPPKPLLLVAAVALLDENNRVLVGSRPVGKPYAGYWEFPGGKIEAGETPEAALARELHEELGIVVDVSHLTPFTFISYPYEKFHMLMPVFTCRVWQGELTAREGQELRWVAPDAFDQYQFVPGSVPLLPQLRSRL